MTVAERKTEKKIEEYVKENTPFVKKTVSLYVRKYPWISSIKEDLISAGIHGLIIAAHKFDQERGYTFLTYAGHYVHRYIKEEIKKYISAAYLPVNKKSSILKAKQIKSQFKIQTGKEPTEKQLKILTGEEAQILMEIETPVSLDQPVEGRDNLYLKDTIPAENGSPEKAVEEEEIQTLVKKMLEEVLNEKERFVIRAYYGFEEEKMNLAEIGRKEGLSRQRIEQIKKQAIKKLRNYTIKNPWIKDLISHHLRPR